MIETRDEEATYDKIYKQVDNYNFFDPRKNAYVDVYARSIRGRILDAGCGEGAHLKRMLGNKIEAFGIELSGVCCQKYLTDLPHRNVDIVTHATSGTTYDGLICMDVLEHISPAELEDNLKALRRLSPSVFLGIANHSDVQGGMELHHIQENSGWWLKRLGSHFSRCTLVKEFPFPKEEPNFFLIECENETSAVSEPIPYSDGSVDQLVSSFRSASNGMLSMMVDLEFELQELATQNRGLAAELGRLSNLRIVRLERFAKRCFSRGS